MSDMYVSENVALRLSCTMIPLYWKQWGSLVKKKLMVQWLWLQMRLNAQAHQMFTGINHHNLQGQMELGYEPHLLFQGYWKGVSSMNIRH